MNGKKIQALIIAFWVSFTLIACGGGTTNTNNNTFPVVVFSDVHFNPFYDPSLFQRLVSADAGEWAGIFQTSKITAPSAWGSDTNYPALVLALASIKQNLGTSPLIIFTGDILGHGIPQYFYTYLNGTQNPRDAADVAAMKAFADKTVAFVMAQVRLSVGDIPVMFALGNMDSYTGIAADSSFLSNTADLYFTKFLNSAADHQAFLDTFLAGGYYSAEPPGTNLMSISLNTIIFSPSPYIGDVSSTVDAELAWLDERLASAKAQGKKVWLLMHAPPGADINTTATLVDNNGHIASAAMMWKADYQTRFLQILLKYPGIITLMLAGHTHMDEYRILPTSDVVEITPSISPWFANNPAFKVLSLSSDTLKATDYSILNYDLATNPLQFNSSYTFSAAYSVQGLLDDSLTQLFPALVTDHAKQELYRQHYLSGHHYAIPVTNAIKPITDANWSVYWCGIGNMGQQEVIDCVNTY
ncbi:MAG: metallophosphoesterase [Syntrophales bacterium]